MEHELDPWVVETAEAHLPALERYVRSFVRDPDEAADICQEVALRLLIAARNGAAPENPAAWMFRVAHNLVVSRGRRVAIARKSAPDLIDRRTEPDVEDEILAREQRAAVHAALSAAPQDHREAIVAAANGQPMRDIATRIGRSELATRSMLCRARVRIRGDLAAAGLL